MEGTENLDRDDAILVTGAAGFIGSRVVDSLLEKGWKNIRCFVRPSSDLDQVRKSIAKHPAARVEIIKGNLLSPDDCIHAVKGVKVVIHLVTGRGKLFSACYQNSVITTRNLLDAIISESTKIRLVNVSSFAVYSNFKLGRGKLLDENCTLENNHKERYDAYVYAKLKQDELVEEYSSKYGLRFATIRPGYVIGPGKEGIPGAVGIDTFGIFFHIGGSNKVPITYVDNCADAIALAGVAEEMDNQVFNVWDDDLPTSRQLLKRYKKEVRRISSFRVPYSLFYLFCKFWEWYVRYSKGQLPAVFNRRFCAFQWKGHSFDNRKLKERIGWKPKVGMTQALDQYFEYQKNGYN